MQPSEFWKMSPSEVQFYLSIKAKENAPNLTEANVERYEERRKELEAKGVIVA